MLGMLTRFATDGPAVHVAPANDFTIAGLHITNSILYGWIIGVLIIVLLTSVATKVRIKPVRGLTQYIEAGVEFVRGVVLGAFDDKRVGRKYVPFFVTLFFIVLLNNWSGLIPLVGDPLQIHGHPFLRPFTADLNATLAIGLVTMVYVYVSSVREVGGVRKYVRHFFAGSPTNPLYFVIGIIEMITDLTRALSLALRLFLNVTIGEIVIGVFSYLGSLIAPHSILSPIAAVPFTLLELGVGALQAYIFVILGVNYLAMTVNSAHAHEELADTPSPSVNAVASELGDAS